MNLTSGQITFAAIFLVAFAIIITWAYLADRKKQQKYFRGAWKILLIACLFFIILYAFVKLK